MREANAWDTVKTQWSKTWHLVRITDKLQGGIPDILWLARDGRSGFVELKADDWVRPDQALFLWRWVKAGGRAGILKRDAGEWVYWRTVDDYQGWLLKIVEDRWGVPHKRFKNLVDVQRFILEE